MITNIKNGEWHHADCFDAMKSISDGSIDMVLCDLPYGTTACKWDAILPFEKLWKEYWRISKPNAAIVLTASQPFTSALVMSAPKQFRHSWIWNKRFAANVMQAKRQPLKIHEDVLVFSQLPPFYNRQMSKRDTPIKAGGANAGSAIPNLSGEEARNAWSTKVYDDKCPESIITYNVREGRGIHPTQKPVALFEYLIRTYTKKGDTVLDNTAGSGTTAIAAENAGRKWICIERDEEYSRKAIERINTLPFL